MTEGYCCNCLFLHFFRNPADLICQGRDRSVQAAIPVLCRRREGRMRRSCCRESGPGCFLRLGAVDRSGPLCVDCVRWRRPPPQRQQELFHKTWRSPMNSPQALPGCTAQAARRSRKLRCFFVLIWMLQVVCEQPQQVLHSLTNWFMMPDHPTWAGHW